MRLSTVKPTIRKNKTTLTSHKLLWDIFVSFLRIGPISFGGGYAMIPMIQKEMVERRQWVTDQEITEIFAVAESVPGAIAINTATFIGYRLARIRGAIVAMLGMLVPTFVIMVLLSIFFIFFKDNAYMSAAFEAIRASIVALIVYAAIKIGQTAILDKTTILLIAITVVILIFTPVHPVFVIIGGGILGIIIVQIRSWLGITTKLEQDENKYIYEDYFIGDGI